MSNTLKTIGMIIGEANPMEFVFATEEKITRLEYILIKSTESLNGKDENVDVIAQIYQIFSNSRALTNDLKINDAQRIIQAGLADTRTFANAWVLGYINKGNVYQPRRAIQPGSPVYLAPENVLEEFYSYEKEEGLYIGNLISRSKVPVNITVKGFRRHMAILAQTGAGKSYTAGVLAEELLAKGATILIIDPHADYVLLGKNVDGTKNPRVEVFRTPDSTGRYDAKEIGKKIQDYGIRFSDLTQQEIEIICGISPKWAKIKEDLENALMALQTGYSLQDLINELNKPEYRHGAKNYVRKLNHLKVFGTATTDVDKFIKPQQISVLDLSGLEDSVSDYVIYRILTEINYKFENNFKYPIFIFIEESHKFIPVKESTLSKRLVKRIAAEGRKFGIFLVLITQRPYKIDQDALSQCNSQIIMRMTNPSDQNAIRQSSERMSGDLLSELPGLNIGEAVIVGETTKAPVMVRIRKRKTMEGGGDIDIVVALKKAREQAKKDSKEKPQKQKNEIKALKTMME